MNFADDVTFSGTITNSTSTTLLTINPGATLTLDGATIYDGTISNSGTIDIALSSMIDGGATVNAGSNFSVESGATLTFNDATVDGGTITNKGTIDVTGAGLTLAGGAIDGGTINNSGGINVSISGEIDDHASLNGSITVQSTATLRSTM